MKKPAEPATGNFWESPLESVYSNIRKNLKDHPHADFIEIYLGLFVIIVFLFFASLAPYIGEKLGLLSQKKETQQSFAKEEDRALQEPEAKSSLKAKDPPGIVAGSPQAIESKSLPEVEYGSVSKNLNQPKTNTNLSGNVSSAENGLPTADAEVTISNSEYRTQVATNSQGGYQIQNIPPGKYAVEIKKDGFKSEKKPAVLAGGMVISLNFELSK